MTATYAGVYRQYATLSGSAGVAHVNRFAETDSRRERYMVTDPRGNIVAVCWRHGIPDDREPGMVPWLDGGWTRALAIAEQCAEAAPCGNHTGKTSGTPRSSLASGCSQPISWSASSGPSTIYRAPCAGSERPMTQSTPSHTGDVSAMYGQWAIRHTYIVVAKSERMKHHRYYLVQCFPYALSEEVGLLAREKRLAVRSVHDITMLEVTAEQAERCLPNVWPSA